MNFYIFWKLLFLAVFFKFSSGYAQQELMSLKYSEGGLVQNRNFYIDSVIDARVIRNNIGIVQIGLNNKKVEANFSRSLTEEFTSCLLNRFPKENLEQRRIVLVVRDLWINEFSGVFNEVGGVSLNLSFCVIGSNGLATTIFETNKYLEESSKKDVTRSHPDRIVKLLEESVSSFANNKDFDTHRPYSNRKEMAFLSNNIQTGVYRDFIGFLNNSVGDSVLAIKKYKSDGRQAFLDKSYYKENMQRYFAMYDGKDLFINSFVYGLNNNYFAKVVSCGRYILVDDTVTPALAGVLFGVIGSAALSHRGIVIDILDGLPRILNEENFIEIIKSNPEILKYYKSINHNSFEIKKSLIDKINKNFNLTLGKQS